MLQTQTLQIRVSGECLLQAGVVYCKQESLATSMVATSTKVREMDEPSDSYKFTSHSIRRFSIVTC